MTDIYEIIRENPNKIPKYTRFEIALMIKMKRLESSNTIQEVSIEYGVTEGFWESVESASRLFNVKIINFASSYLGIPKNELIALEDDNFDNLNYRTQEKIPKVTEDIEIADKIFSEIIMQYKISTKLEGE